jgi:hypothetical protein
MKTIALVLLVVSLSGCTVLYKPASDWEREAINKANFDIYPNDVRSNIEVHKLSSVAWAGLIKSFEIDESASPIKVNFVLEHHFFTWAIDGTTRKFWLSPKGEGEFSARWQFQEGVTAEMVRENVYVDDLMITYGVPNSVSDADRIDLGDAYYMRLFPKESYRTDVIEYGRSGEPTKSLSLGL